MGVLSALKDWLQGFDGGVITTDILLAQSPARSLSTGASGTSMLDIAGNRTYSNNYVFRIRSLSLDEADRVDNNDLLERFTDWVRDKDWDGDYPILDRGTVEEVRVTNAVPVTINEDGTSEYEVLLTIRIFERRTKWQK